MRAEQEGDKRREIEGDKRGGVESSCNISGSLASESTVAPQFSLMAE